MDDEQLGRRIFAAAFPNIIHAWTKGELKAFGRAARELLAKPVATREVVRVLDDNFTRLEALNVLELLQSAGLNVVRG